MCIYASSKQIVIVFFLLFLFIINILDVYFCIFGRFINKIILSQFIYTNETFEKPFFCTYVKTSMFTLYLLGFLFWQPWKDSCSRPSNYIFVDTEQEDENYYTDNSSRLSNPVYVPVKTAEIDKNSGTESDDSSVRAVRFNKLAEVRHMSETDATEALLARLSYQASLRAGEIAKRAAIKLPVLRVAKISLVFCLLVSRRRRAATCLWCSGF